MDCIFCRIANNQIPSKKIYEDEKIIAFSDINPQAPQHLLIIPREHISSIMETENHAPLMGYLISKIPEIARKAGMDEKSIRLISNCGENAGQSVFHIHFHLLAGRDFKWPPG